MNLKLLVMLIVFGGCYGQTRIKFDYDEAGNQTRRYICVNCAARLPQQDSLKSADKKFVKDEVSSKVSYYPNPVLEELNLRWDHDKNRTVTKIELYSMTGQLLQVLQVKQEHNSAIVPFNSYSQGYYNVLLYFNDNSSESLKVIKK